jgi:hypothetical protein
LDVRACSELPSVRRISADGGTGGEDVGGDRRRWRASTGARWRTRRRHHTRARSSCGPRWRRASNAACRTCALRWSCPPLASMRSRWVRRPERALLDGPPKHPILQAGGGRASLRRQRLGKLAVLVQLRRRRAHRLPEPRWAHQHHAAARTVRCTRRHPAHLAHTCRHSSRRFGLHSRCFGLHSRCFGLHSHGPPPTFGVCVGGGGGGEHGNSHRRGSSSSGARPSWISWRTRIGASWQRRRRRRSCGCPPR